MRVDARRWPVREERFFKLYTHYCGSYKSLKGEDVLEAASGDKEKKVLSQFLL